MFVHLDIEDLALLGERLIDEEAVSGEKVHQESHLIFIPYVQSICHQFKEPDILINNALDGWESGNISPGGGLIVEQIFDLLLEEVDHRLLHILKIGFSGQ